MGFWSAVTEGAVDEVRKKFKPAVTEALRKVLDEQAANGGRLSDDYLYHVYKDAYLEAAQKIKLK